MGVVLRHAGLSRRGSSLTARTVLTRKDPMTDLSWHLPADTEPQERMWLSFPRATALMGSTPWEISAARRAWARIAHEVADFEPVTLLVDPADRTMVHTYVDPIVPVIPQRFDSPFIRLTGPVFTTGPGAKADANGRRPLGMMDFVFNGFGRRPGLDYLSDSVVTGTMAQMTGATRQLSLMTLEGGAFVTDGEGTVIVSEAALLDPARNPGWSRRQVELEFHRYTDVRKVIWLPGGLTRDAGPRGTGGMVDQLVTFASPTVVLLHWQDDPSHPDHAVSQTALELLQGETDAQGRPLNIATIPAPSTLTDRHGPVGWSYVNVLPVNGAVVVPSFEDEHDDGAHQVLEAAFWGRKVIPVPARQLYERGVGIRHVGLTQPARPARPPASAA